MLRLAFVLLILPYLGSSTAQARQLDATSNQTSEERFVQEFILSVRTDLRASLHLLDYYEACITDDEKWFIANNQDSSLYSKQFCFVHLKPILDGIKDRYPKMRLLMGLAQYEYDGDSFPVLNDLPPNAQMFPFDPQKKEFNFLVRVQDRIRHDFNGAVSLPPLTKKEQWEAEALRFNDLKGRRQWREGFSSKKDLLETTYCSTYSDESFFPVAVYECYKEQYYKMILGDADRDTKPLPILLYVTSPTPTQQELITALEAIRSNAQELLSQLEDKYFVVESDGQARIRDEISLRIDDNLDLFFFKGAAQNLIEYSEYTSNNDEKKQEWTSLLQTGLNRLSKSNNIKMWTQIGGMIVWGIGCNILMRGLLSKGLCELPIGLGANLYFYQVDSSAFSYAIRAAFYRADGHRNVVEQDPNSLSDLQFSETLSMAMLPFFTGIPKIFKAIKSP